jgi:hypothetical protein
MGQNYRDSWSKYVISSAISTLHLVDEIEYLGGVLYIVEFPE